MAGGAAELAAIIRIKNEGQADLDHFRGGLQGIMGDFLGIPPAAVGAAAGIAVAGAAIAGLTAAAFELGSSFDDAFDSIQLKSGATGERLETLKEDFRAVVANVPVDFETAGNAIGALAARTGQSGESLQTLATSILNLSRITGTDASENVRNLTRLYGDWSIATDQQAAANDKLFVLSQMTGASIGELTQRVVQFGAPMRQLGLSFDEATALMAKWEQEGVNVETVSATMRIALAKFAEAGVDPQLAFKGLIRTLQDMEDPIAATQLAMEIFGKKGGADMAAAIREGRFAVDELVEGMQGSEGAIDDAAESTDDAKQKMQTAMNDIALAFEPVGTAVFQMATDAATAFAGFVKSASDARDNVLPILHFFQGLSGIGTGIASLMEPAGVARAVAGMVTGGTANAAAGPNFSDLQDQETGAGMMAAAAARDSLANWQAWRDAQDEIADVAEDGAEARRRQREAEDAEAARFLAGNAGESAEEKKARLAAEREAQREIQQAQREAVQEAKRVAAEAKREAEQAAREAKRFAENEAKRLVELQDLGQKRSDTINEAVDKAAEAQELAHQKAVEGQAKAEADFERQRDLADERKKLEKAMETGLKAQQDEFAGARRATQTGREDEDLGLRRAREDADLMRRREQAGKSTAEQERKDLEAMNAARFKGNSLEILALQKAQQDRKTGNAEQLAEEDRMLTLRRAREDEDLIRRRGRQEEDLAITKRQLEETAALRDQLKAPLEEMQQRLLQETLDEKITGYWTAYAAAVNASNLAFERTESSADRDLNRGIERLNRTAGEGGTVFNFYNNNYGTQGEGVTEELMDAMEEEVGDFLATF